MNGNDFIKEIKAQTLAIKYMGECCCSFGISYDDYSKCEKRMIDFLKRNTINIVSCLDVYGYNPNWSNTYNVCNDIIYLFEAGDYDEFLFVLTKNNTSWKYREKLKKINITLF